MTSSYDPIDDALNTSSNSIEVSTTPEGGCAKRKDQIKNVSDDVVLQMMRYYELLQELNKV